MQWSNCIFNPGIVLAKSPLYGLPSSCIAIHVNQAPGALQSPKHDTLSMQDLNIMIMQVQGENFQIQKRSPRTGFELESLWPKSWNTDTLDCSAIICWQFLCYFFKFSNLFVFSSICFNFIFVWAFNDEITITFFNYNHKNKNPFWRPFLTAIMKLV